MPYADSHVHLDRYATDQAADMLARAAAAGVTLLLNVGVDIESSRRAAAVSRQFGPAVQAAAGVHPRRLHTVDPVAALESIQEMVEAGEAAAIGEVGLDYANGAAESETQRDFLRSCLRLAARLDVLIVLHVVGAHDDALTLLLSERPARAVVHYFQGDAALVHCYLEAGCAVSPGKPVTRPENSALRAAIRDVPLDRLLVETDTYPVAGRTTEPRDVAEVCRAIAEIRGVAAGAIAAATYANLARLLFPRGRR